MGVQKFPKSIKAARRRRQIRVYEKGLAYSGMYVYVCGIIVPLATLTTPILKNVIGIGVRS